MKLSNFLKHRSLRIKYSKLNTRTASDGSTITEFTLRTPLKNVVGSQILNALESPMRLTASNVKYVCIHEVVAERVQLDKKKKCVWTKKCMLDVAKAGTVWIVAESFKSIASSIRAEHRDRVVFDILRRSEERRARGENNTEE